MLDGAADNDTLNLADGATGDTANGGGNMDTCRVSTGDKKSSCESAGGS